MKKQLSLIFILSLSFGLIAAPLAAESSELLKPIPTLTFAQFRQKLKSIAAVPYREAKILYDDVKVFYNIPAA